MIEIKDIADLARKLCAPAANESRIRCAIGRAYYAAYHYCLSAADAWCTQLRPEEEEGKGKHEKLYDRLQGHSKKQELDKELRLIAEDAKKLRTLRVGADYDLSKDYSMRDLTRGLGFLKQVEDRFANLPKAKD